MCAARLRAGPAPLVALAYDVNRLLDFALREGTSRNDEMSRAVERVMRGLLGRVSTVIDAGDAGVRLWGTFELK